MEKPATKSKFQVQDAGAVPLIAKDISHVDAPLKRQVCSCLAQIAKHSVDLAEVVLDYLLVFFCFIISD